jgi:hypothetical protein
MVTLLTNKERMFDWETSVMPERDVFYDRTYILKHSALKYQITRINYSMAPKQ